MSIKNHHNFRRGRGASNKGCYCPTLPIKPQYSTDTNENIIFANIQVLIPLAFIFRNGPTVQNVRKSNRQYCEETDFWIKDNVKAHFKVSVQLNSRLSFHFQDRKEEQCIYMKRFSMANYNIANHYRSGSLLNTCFSKLFFTKGPWECTINLNYNIGLTVTKIQEKLQYGTKK